MTQKASAANPNNNIKRNESFKPMQMKLDIIMWAAAIDGRTKIDSGVEFIGGKSDNNSEYAIIEDDDYLEANKMWNNSINECIFSRKETVLCAF